MSAIWENWSSNYKLNDIAGWDKEVSDKLKTNVEKHFDKDDKLYTLFTEGGVYLRPVGDSEALKVYENCYEYVAIHIDGEGDIRFTHGTVDLEDYLNNKEFIEYAEEENMTPEQLMGTGTFAASWVLENNEEYIWGDVMAINDIADKLDSLGVTYTEELQATDIDWDIDEEEGMFCPDVPYEVSIPADVAIEAAKKNDTEIIADYLSDTFGYCVNGFNLSQPLDTLIKKDKSKSDVDMDR